MEGTGHSACLEGRSRSLGICGGKDQVIWHVWREGAGHSACLEVRSRSLGMSGGKEQVTRHVWREGAGHSACLEMRTVECQNFIKVLHVTGN